MLIQVRRRPETVVVFICNLMRIGRWSELTVDRVYQEPEVMREANVPVENTIVNLLIESAVLLPLVSVNL